jgi:hypothetical protein
VKPRKLGGLARKGLLRHRGGGECAFYTAILSDSLVNTVLHISYIYTNLLTYTLIRDVLKMVLYIPKECTSVDSVGSIVSIVFN